jgi:hypothetical protein
MKALRNMTKNMKPNHSVNPVALGVDGHNQVSGAVFAPGFGVFNDV